MTFADTRIEKGQAEYTQADKKSVSSVESVSKNSSSLKSAIGNRKSEFGNPFAPQLKRRHTIYDIRNTNSAKCAGIYDQNPKILKKSSPFLTPYFTTSYVLRYPLYAICYPLFFRPNAQVHPFIGNDYWLLIMLCRKP